MNIPTLCPGNLPDDLLAQPNFVAWRYEERDGKATKLPIDIHTGRLASTTAPATWATFEEALPFARRHGSGIGFVFGERDGFAGVDLDACIDAETLLIAPWAWEIVVGLDSYTEVSPSGRGLHTFIRAALPPTGRRKGAVEMYDRARFFTVTGERLPDVSPLVESRQAQIEALHAQLFPPAPPLPAGATAPLTRDLADFEIVQRAMSAANGLKFSRLWLGDRSGYNSDSEADAALVALLAFWVGPDPARLDALFRQSALVRGKWERASYRDRTIALALQRGEYYEPGRGAHVAVGPRRRKGAAFMPR